MLAKIRPDFFFQRVQDIPLQELKEKGIVGIIIDLDNTLTEWNSKDIKTANQQWLKKLIANGFKVCIVSNNNLNLVKENISKLDISFISYAFKPRKKAFIKALQKLKTGPQNTAVIGDQLFTDIVGGKRIGATTILVSPLSNRDFFTTKIVRKIEKKFLAKFH